MQKVKFLMQIRKMSIHPMTKKKDVFCYVATNPQYENDYNLINFTLRAHKKTTSKEFI